MTATYDKPVPEATPESAPYWQGLREHRLLLQRCRDCGEVRHYPRPMCARCYGMECDWIPAAGRGTVYSWTVCHHAFHPAFKADLPYILVTVDLEEGVRLLAQLFDADPGDMRLGLPVEVVFENATSELTLPAFRPA